MSSFRVVTGGLLTIALAGGVCGVAVLPASASSVVAGVSSSSAPPSPVQALQTWYDANGELKVSFAVPGGHPDVYDVTVTNNKTGVVEYSTVLSTVPSPSHPLTVKIDAPKTTHLVDVVALNQTGSSAVNRAHVKASSGVPSNVTSTRFVLLPDPDGGYLTNVSWNAPKFSPLGQILSYNVYDANKKLMFNVDDTTATLTRAQSDRANPAVYVSALTQSGAEGPLERVGIEIPDDGYQVKLTNVPATAVEDTPVSVSGRSAGYNPGNWVNTWVQNPDGQWIDADGSITNTPEFSTVPF